ncbi:MAG TPA: DNA replication and repair protein RecF [Vicinamibacteria bacterium]|nr:DNA replication and repair protein RecF [Vicinamibacteria bacterium]
MVWVESLTVRDFRNIEAAALDLHPGINVFHGRNAQGKTSLLEAVGVLARGRSFRTEDAPSMIRRGAAALVARGLESGAGGAGQLEVELQPQRRVFRVDGRDVSPREYQGRLEVIVYSTARLRVVHGSMRDRRLFLDRQAAALWPSYRAELRSFERLLQQRNAALEKRSADLDAWTERFVESGARLRHRRALYAERLTAALAAGFRPAGESYVVALSSRPRSEEDSRRSLRAEIAALAARERAAGRSLAGPHRDGVALLLDGRDAGEGASSGQARSLLLALALASLALHREETGRSAVALLDDLDSELDEGRAAEVCQQVVRGGQALVTSAHAGWAESLRPLGQVFSVVGGMVRCA